MDEKLKKLKDAMESVDKIMKDKTYIHKSNTFQYYKITSHKFEDNLFLWLDEQFLMLQSLQVILYTFLNNRFIYDEQSIINDIKKHINYLEDVSFNFTIELQKIYYENPNETILKSKLLYQNIYELYNELRSLNGLQNKNIEIYNNFNLLLDIINDIVNFVKQIVDIQDAKSIDIEINNNTFSSPFIDKEVEQLFYFLCENWGYKSDLRYAYIFNFITDELGHKLNFTDYAKFINLKYQVPRVFLDKATSKPKLQLPIIYKEFLKK